MTSINRIQYNNGDKVGNCFYVEDDMVIKWKRYCIFKCNCGTTFSARLDSIKSLKIRSCGCLHKEFIKNKQTVHGHCANGISPEYKSWASMKKRCYDKSHTNYNKYGGSGVTVCDRWIESFENFLSDMGKKPSLNHSIDRIDNNGNYEPANCRWADRATQNRNKSTNIMLTHNGETKCLKDWAEYLGISHVSLRGRIKRLGWSTDDALSKPFRVKRTALCS